MTGRPRHRAESFCLDLYFYCTDILHYIVLTRVLYSRKSLPVETLPISFTSLIIFRVPEQKRRNACTVMVLLDIYSNYCVLANVFVL